MGAELTMPLSNVQVELLKMYTTNLSDEDLNELRDLMAQFYGKRAIRRADAIWDERGLTDADMDKWLNNKAA
jgi:hypothetical protein